MLIYQSIFSRLNRTSIYLAHFEAKSYPATCAGLRHDIQKRPESQDIDVLDFAKESRHLPVNLFRRIPLIRKMTPLHISALDICRRLAFWLHWCSDCRVALRTCDRQVGLQGSAFWFRSLIPFLGSASWNPADERNPEKREIPRRIGILEYAKCLSYQIHFVGHRVWLDSSQCLVARAILSDNNSCDACRQVPMVSFGGCLWQIHIPPRAIQTRKLPSFSMHCKSSPFFLY